RAVRRRPASRASATTARAAGRGRGSGRRKSQPGHRRGPGAGRRGSIPSMGPCETLHNAGGVSVYSDSPHQFRGPKAPGVQHGKGQARHEIRFFHQAAQGLRPQPGRVLLAHRDRHRRQRPQGDRGRPGALPRRRFHPLPEDPQLPLERDRSDVQLAACDVHGPVHRAVERAGRGRRAHPRAGLQRPRFLCRVHPPDLDPRGAGRRRRSGLEGHGPAAGRGQRGGVPHRAQRAQDRRRRRRRSDRGPADPAPADPREVRLDAALAAGISGRRGTPSCGRPRAAASVLAYAAPRRPSMAGPACWRGALIDSVGTTPRAGMALSRPSIDGLHALLRDPAASRLPASLRELLLQAWDAEGTGHQASLPWPVIADTLRNLVALDADEPALAAALLYDLPGLRAVVAARVCVQWPAVTGLLDGQDAADQVWALHAGREAGRNGEGLRRLLLAIIQDLRVVPVLLSRQLARMRAAQDLPGEEQRALAQLTRDIHAPLANRLGIWQLKWELEDLAFRALEPDTYRRIAHELDESRADRERYIESVKAQLGRALAVHGLAAEISGRPKHIYSIWRKMQKKQLPLDKLYDLRAVRVMVADVAACYAALGVVHSLWVPVPGEFDDYIARPKPDGESSMDTAVVGPEGRTLEVQVRTREMHEQAELGVAAHWRYKETGGSAAGKGAGRAFGRKIAWMRQLLEQASENRDEGLAAALD